MGSQRLTDINSTTGVTFADYVHIVNPNDVSQDPAGSSFKATIEQVAMAVNLLRPNIEVTFTSYPDQRYTRYGPHLNPPPEHMTYCCSETPTPFDEFPPNGCDPCDPSVFCRKQWNTYIRPITPSVEVSVSGGTVPYTYEWSIAESDEAGHRFRGCYNTDEDKIYLDVNFVKIPTVSASTLTSVAGKLPGPYYPKTTSKENGATMAGTTLKLKVTDANGFNNTFYYRYTSEDCYPVKVSNCNSYNVEFCDEGQTFSKLVTSYLDFMDDVRVIPTCTDLSSYGIFRPELNEEDIRIKLMAQRDLFMSTQLKYQLAYNAGDQFQPKDQPVTGGQGYRLDLNLLTYPHDLYMNNNGKAPLKYINVFDGGWPISTENIDYITPWTDTIDPFYGTTLAVRYPNIFDLVRRPTVKSVLDLPVAGNPIPLAIGQIVKVFETNDEYIWNDVLTTWELISNSPTLLALLSSRQTRRNAQISATNQMLLAMKPFVWSGVYMFQHAIKNYKELQITNT